MATQNYQIQENCDKCQDNDPPVINPAVSFCKKCKEILCQQHSKIHHRNRVPAEHVLIDLSTAADLLASTPVTCATHAGEKNIAFCITCNQSLCGICLVKNSLCQINSAIVFLKKLYLPNFLSHFCFVTEYFFFFPVLMYRVFYFLLFSTQFCF